MRSSSCAGVVVAAAVSVTVATGRAHADPPAAPGFAVERLNPAPAGVGWIVMDDLDMQPGLGGALGIAFGYEHEPLHLGTSPDRLDVVSERTVADIAAAVTYDRWRFSLALETLFASGGESGASGGYAFTAPSANPADHPDAIGDPRLGVDVRLVGNAGDPFRFGVSGQLFAPNGSRADYDTDGSFRGIVRALVAGDVAPYAYAGYLGVHIRPLDDPEIPGSPQGSELVFGAAGGGEKQLPCWKAVGGPEVFGATAVRSACGGDTTALEALLSARLEQTAGAGRRIRVRLGVGGGLNPEFGAPEWRVIAGVEMFGQAHRAPPPPPAP